MKISFTVVLDTGDDDVPDDMIQDDLMPEIAKHIGSMDVEWIGRPDVVVVRRGRKFSGKQEE